jgi:hypothetical protein
VHVLLVEAQSVSESLTEASKKSICDEVYGAVGSFSLDVSSLVADYLALPIEGAATDCRLIEHCVRALIITLDASDGESKQLVASINPMHLGFSLTAMANQTPLPFNTLTTHPQIVALATATIEGLVFDARSQCLFVFSTPKYNWDDEPARAVQADVLHLKYHSATGTYSMELLRTGQLRHEAFHFPKLFSTFFDPTRQLIWTHASDGGWRQGVYGFDATTFAVRFSWETDADKSFRENVVAGMDALFVDATASTLIIARTDPPTGGCLTFHPFAINDDDTLTITLEAKPAVPTLYRSCSTGSDKLCPFVVDNDWLFLYEYTHCYDRAALLALSFGNRSSPASSFSVSASSSSFAASSASSASSSSSSASSSSSSASSSSSSASSASSSASSASSAVLAQSCTCSGYNQELQRLCDSCIQQHALGSPSPAWILPINCYVSSLQLIDGVLYAFLRDFIPSDNRLVSRLVRIQ